MDPSKLTLTPLRISTMVVTAHLGTTLNLQTLLECFHEQAIPLSWPAEGPLKLEYKPIQPVPADATKEVITKAKTAAKLQEKVVIGTCSRDELTSRKKSKNIFFNQATLVVRRRVTPDLFKEVNIKLFRNGGVQMTGIPSDEFAQATLAWLATLLASFSRPVLETPAAPRNYSIQLINSDYQVNGTINRERLHEILVQEYNLFSSFESTIYQGCDTKYYYNEAAPPGATEGICPCGEICSGTGDGRSIGACKEITISPFHTGSIIITGARRFEQIQKAYVFINKILTRHCAEVIKPHPLAAAKAAPATKDAPTKASKSRSEKLRSTPSVATLSP
jgi:TATA-box binding protein (TBP) (component of TFIID and TFIIIB)